MGGSNWKTAALVLLSFAVLVLGALLPGILADIQEQSYAPGFAAMNSVELQLRSDGNISLKDAISLVCNSTNTVEVGEEMTTRTAAEVMDLAEELLQPYLELGLIIAPGLDVRSQTYSCVPNLVVSEGEAASSVIFWQVLILFDEEEPALRLAIEDQTGALAALDYHYSKTDYVYSGVTYFVPDATLETLCKIYLDGLGEEFTEYTPTVAQTYTDADGVTAQHWNFSWEGTFGPAGISFDVWPYGISISLF